MTEIPLLPDDLFGLAVRRRPSNGEFLQAVARWLQKMKLYPTHGQGLIEDEANLLLPLLGCSPAWTAIGTEGGFNGKVGIFRGDFDRRDPSSASRVTFQQ